jgi:YfiR/HmsC-like
MKTAARLIVVLLAVVITAQVVRAEENVQLVEQKIKAGLIYNFLKYTQWPQGSPRQAGTTIVVCLFGGDPFDGNLQPMAGRTVNQRSIEIREIGSAADAPACAMLVLNGGRKADWAQLKGALAGKDILTVSDFDGFAESGGMIEFTRIDSRIGVKINTDAVTATHLAVEDRLLKLASAMRAPASP